ncbi:MAG: lysine exporter LysO family protein [Fusobacteriaceae bacterium]
MIGILVSVASGIIFGLFFKIPFLVKNIDIVIDIGLCLLLFFVGLDMGKNNFSFSHLKKFGKRIWFLPLTVILGTYIGATFASFFVTETIGEVFAVASGFGWYSFSAVEIAKRNPELGSLAFLVNVFRELISIFMIPFVAKKIGDFEAVSLAGAPAMDVTLPIIDKYTNSDIAGVSFFTGFIISILVPVLVPLTMKIFNI